MNRTAITFISLLFLLVCDYIWISSNNDMYKSMVETVQRQPMSVNIAAASIAYVFVAFAFVAIAIPKVETTMMLRGGTVSLLDAASGGAIIGLAIYGIYNATNMAIFVNYGLKAAVADTLWGTTLFSMATCFYAWLRTKN